MGSVVLKIVIVCVLTAFLSLTIKNSMPSFAPVLAVACGMLSFYLLVPYIENLIVLIRGVSDKISGVDKYVAVTVKIIGVSLICEFASQICSDMGESYLSSKINIGGKVIIISMCAPELLNLINTVVDMISLI